uniref:BMA-MAB-23 n=1 Tax=Brugia malayi TaxID=6279 RepID=A0A0H5S1R7_BRUMA|nr:BMA-MAB-23 [Brugia malayi]
MPKEQYMCQLCANHGMFNQPKKGHKQKCPYRHCPCNLCALNTKRRALDQIERQLKNGSTNLQISAELMNDKIDLCDARSTILKSKNMDHKNLTIIDSSIMVKFIHLNASILFVQLFHSFIWLFFTRTFMII